MPTTTVAEYTEKLTNAYDAICDEASYKSYLSILGRLHKYSLNNVILIWMQRPGSSRCAGFGQWQEMGRQVRKGESALKIFAPMIKKTEEEGVPKSRLIGFRVVNVFDITQTDGPPLPTIRFDEDVDIDPDYFIRLNQLLADNGVPVTYYDEGSDLCHGSGCYGYYNLMTKQIFIRSGTTPVMELKTTIHEAAHHFDMTITEKDDTDNRPYRMGELIAESVAYVVCTALEVPTQEFSISYIQLYAESKDELKFVLKRVKRLSEIILTTLKPEESTDGRNAQNAGDR